MKYSVIIPVYNRPDEVDELLASLSKQNRNDFEVLVIEDGSERRCDEIAEKYQAYFPIRYFFKKNEGPGIARNFGYHQAKGEFFVAFDSDCIIPPGYFHAVDEALAQHHYDAWGGPDRPHPSFTPVQRAMGYTMSSILTTGGIRGGKKRVGWFQPRSFNIGFSRRTFELTGGFRAMRVSEDIDLSIRMKKLGLNIGLVPEAYVYHKRRTNFSQFFKQVFSFGEGRAQLGRLHSGEIKITHWFPTFFTLALFTTLILPLINFWLFGASMFLLTAYFFSIFFHSLAVSRSPVVAILSVPAALIQLTGYGLGFIKGLLKTYS